MTIRTATVERNTNETRVTLTLALDGRGKADVETGVGFLDHLLRLFAHHALFDLTVRCEGDIVIDAHHSVEDVAICLGLALDQALGERAGIVRTGHSYVPMDETLALGVVDLSGRPYAVIETQIDVPMLGQMDADLVRHFLETFATNARLNLHARVLYGMNGHHKAEALFKAAARALDMATRRDPRREGIPSTKGMLV